MNLDWNALALLFAGSALSGSGWLVQRLSEVFSKHNQLQRTLELEAMQLKNEQRRLQNELTRQQINIQTHRKN